MAWLAADGRQAYATGSTRSVKIRRPPRFGQHTNRGGRESNAQEGAGRSSPHIIMMLAARLWDSSDVTHCSSFSRAVVDAFLNVPNADRPPQPPPPPPPWDEPGAARWAGGENK